MSGHHKLIMATGILYTDTQQKYYQAKDLKTIELNDVQHWFDTLGSELNNL